jgi:hypothetical protein
MLFRSGEMVKLNSAAEALAVANDGAYSEALLGIGKQKFDLHNLASFQFGRNVDRHSVFAQIVAASLKDAFTVVHDRKQLYREVHLKPLRAACPPGDRIGGWSWHCCRSECMSIADVIQITVVIAVHYEGDT